jgi:hypothetical protein
MPAIYECPGCRSRFTTGEFLARGGLCPGCGGLLSSTPAPISIQQQKNADPAEIVALQVLPIKGRQAEVAAITQLLNSLGRVRPLCLEIAGSGQRRFMVVRCRRGDEGAVRSQITGIYGAPEIHALPASEDPATLFSSSAIHTGALRLGLARPAGLPLRTYRELIENDTILPIFAALFQVKEGEAALAQVLIHGPGPEGWAAGYKQELLALKRRQVGATPVRELARWLLVVLGAALISLYFLIGQWLSGLWLFLSGLGLVGTAAVFTRDSGLRWSESMEELVTRKVQQSGYRAEVRLAAAGSSKARAEQLLETLAAAYQVFGFEAGNHFEILEERAGFHPHDISPHKPGEMLLGDEEIATLWHLPLGAQPDMLTAARVDDTLPDPLLVARSGENRWRLGEMGKSAGVRLPVYLPRAAITRTHALFMGKTRTGKTTGLENAVRELASEAGRSVVAIDPHDDMVTDLLGVIPLERAGDVLYLNFADPELTPALNLLDVNLFAGDPERTAEALGEVTRAVFKKYWGPRMEVVFDRTVLSLALANSIRPPAQQLTILDALALLNMNKDARLTFLDTVLPENHIQRETLMSYFQWEFDRLSPSMQEQVVMPVLSKLRPFESNSHLLAAFGQPQSTINPITAVRDGKILLVRTGAAVLSAEYSNFIGSLFLNLVRRAILSQAGAPPEARTPVTVIVDESQSFTGVDYGAALAQLAKFGGNLILTTQGAGFIGRSTASDEPDDPLAFARVLSNVDTLLVYRISGEDAVRLAQTEFVDERSPTDLIYLPDYQAFVRFKKDGRLVGPFRVQMDPPPARNEAAAASIEFGRGRYCLPLAAALEGARRSARRIHNYYPNRASGLNAALEGEVQLDDQSLDLGSAREISGLVTLPEAPEGRPTEVERILQDGLAGLGRDSSPGRIVDSLADAPELDPQAGATPEGLARLLENLNTEDPGSE